jgi:hypothetical protein
MSAVPQIVVTIEGGVVQDVSANMLCRVIIVDYDCEGGDEGVIPVQQDGDPGDVEDAILSLWTPTGKEPGEAGLIEQRFREWEGAGTVGAG